MWTFSPLQSHSICHAHSKNKKKQAVYSRRAAYMAVYCTALTNSWIWLVRWLISCLYKDDRRELVSWLRHVMKWTAKPKKSTWFFLLLMLANSCSMRGKKELVIILCIWSVSRWRWPSVSPHTVKPALIIFLQEHAHHILMSKCLWWYRFICKLSMKESIKPDVADLMSGTSSWSVCLHYRFLLSNSTSPVQWLTPYGIK